MDDKAIKKAVETALDFEPSIDAADIGVTVSDGIVSLTGHVPTYIQKLTAESTVKRVKAVRGYVDKIEVRLRRADTDDETIASRAANLIHWDVTLPEGAVKVSVSNGHVTLTGEVPWQYQRLAAERGIRALEGVRSLFNRITVKPTVKAADIQQRIEAALARQADLEADRIRVTVDGAKVRLQGQVRAWFERDLAEQAAWAAPGVLAVQDEVTVHA